MANVEDEEKKTPTITTDGAPTFTETELLDADNEQDTTEEYEDPFDFSDVTGGTQGWQRPELPKSENYTRNMQVLSQYAPKPDAPVDEAKKLRSAYAKQDIHNYAQGIAALASLWGASKGAAPVKFPEANTSTPILSYIKNQEAKRMALGKEVAHAQKADADEFKADTKEALRRQDIYDKAERESEMKKAVLEHQTKEKAKDRKFKATEAEKQRKFQEQQKDKDRKSKEKTSGRRGGASASVRREENARKQEYKRKLELHRKADAQAMTDFMKAQRISKGTEVDPEQFDYWCKINDRGTYKKN